jgi:hypothetical protein
MTKEEAIEIVKKEWENQGSCASCGWHALLYEYDLEFDIDINEKKKRIELPCHTDDDENRIDHRGVRIYY